MGLKDRRSSTDISTDSVPYLFDIDIIERNALRAAAELPLLDVQAEIARLNAFREENYLIDDLSSGSRTVPRMVRQPRWLARELWPMVAAASG